MQIYVTVNLNEGDDLLVASQQAADKVLESLGGDPSKDTCTVQVVIPTVVAGVDPRPQPAPPPVATPREEGP